MIVQDSPSRHLPKMMVRLPYGMRHAIKERARKAGRSMNAEIVQILSAALNHEIQGDDDMARGDAELRIRIPHDLRDAVKAKASETNRTMNGEIVLALQAHLDGSGAPTARDIFAAAAMNALMQTVGDDPSSDAMSFQTSVECAFSIADAMMAERGRGLRL